jgi:hypothetical protein
MNSEQERRRRAGNDQGGDQALPAERRLRVERKDRSEGDEKVRDHVSQPRDEADFVRVRDRKRDGTEREESHRDREERAGHSSGRSGDQAFKVAIEKCIRTGTRAMRLPAWRRFAIVSTRRALRRIVWAASASAGSCVRAAAVLPAGATNVAGGADGTSILVACAAFSSASCAASLTPAAGGSSVRQDGRPCLH